MRTVRSADAERNDLSIGETAKLRTLELDLLFIEIYQLIFITFSYALYNNEYIYYQTKIDIECYLEKSNLYYSVFKLFLFIYHRLSLNNAMLVQHFE